MKIKCEICNFEDSKSILSHVRTLHKMSSQEYRCKYNKPLRVSWLLGNESAMEAFKFVGRNNSERKKGKPSNNMLEAGKWSKNHKACVRCGETDSRHAGRGVCSKCAGKANVRNRIETKNRNLVSSGQEGVDYVVCQECGKPFECLSTYGHLNSIHGMTLQEYRRKHPNALTMPIKIRDKLSAAISTGRKRLHKERGYLNPQSQRDKKRIEITKRIVEQDWTVSKVSQVEDQVARWLEDKGYQVVFFSESTGEIPLVVGRVVFRQFPMLGKFSVDFAFPDIKMVVEVLGTYWHGWDYVTGKKEFKDLGESVKRNVVTDRTRFNEIEAEGWKLVTVWEHDIKVGNLDSLSQALAGDKNEHSDFLREVKIVSARDIMVGKVRYYNARWLCHQNGFLMFPGKTMFESDYNKLRCLMSQHGDEWAVPENEVERLFKQYRASGFPYYSLSNDDMVKLWTSLCGIRHPPKKDNLYAWDKYGVQLASYFHPHMFECKKNGKLSPLEFFYSDDFFRDGIRKVLSLHGHVTDAMVRDICRNDFQSSRVSNFLPRVCSAVLTSLFGDGIEKVSVLDPCAGFGGRLLGFSASHVSRYTGIDLSGKTCSGLERELDFLRKYGLLTEAKIVQGDSNEVMAGLDGGYDLVMTSPPFTDREIYIGVPYLSSLADWIDKFMRPLLVNSFRLLKCDGKLALYMGQTESKGNKLPSVVRDLAVSVGFEVCEPIAFRMGVNECNRNQGATKKTFVQVWRKP